MVTVKEEVAILQEVVEDTTVEVEVDTKEITIRKKEHNINKATSQEINISKKKVAIKVIIENNTNK